MNLSDLGEIKAIAFDIDGTLYKNSDFYPKVAMTYLKNITYFRNFNKVRKQLHHLERPLPNLRAEQSKLLAQRMRISVKAAEDKQKRFSYHGLEATFAKVKMCEGAAELITAAKRHELKVGILSDFPPGQKGDLWGLKKQFDAIVGSEATGQLKPAAHPFEVLAKELKVKPEEILYVGNSATYDVGGAKKAGMKTAYFSPRGKKANGADKNFKSYEQLRKDLFRE